MSLFTSRRDRAIIDLCEACGGVFLNYFDGEPSTVARALGQKLDGQQEPIRLRTYEPTCPNCELSMELLEYLQDDGPPIFRCSACMAVFATPAQRQAVARFIPWTPQPSVLRRIWDALFG